MSDEGGARRLTDEELRVVLLHLTGAVNQTLGMIERLDRTFRSELRASPFSATAFTDIKRRLRTVADILVKSEPEHRE